MILSYLHIEHVQGVYENATTAVGVRPSGEMHLGNMVTLALAAVTSRIISNSAGKVLLTVCDIDRPAQSDWSIDKNRHVRYFASIPDPTGEYGSILGKVQADLARYVTDLGGLKVEFTTQLLSDVQRDPAYRKGLENICNRPDSIKMLFPNWSDSSLVPIYPLCPECKTSDPYPAKFGNGLLTTRCTNSACFREGEYTVSVHDPSVDLSVSYFIDPIRDALVQPQAQVHVFGGDYGDPHGGSGKGFVTKAEKIERTIALASGMQNVPLVVVGPKFLTFEGEPMKKSARSGITFDAMYKRFGPDTAWQVYNMLHCAFDQKFYGIKIHPDGFE